MISRTNFTTIWPFLCALASRPACFHCAPIVQDQCVEARFMVQWKRNDWLDVFYSFRLNLPMKMLLVLALLFQAIVTLPARDKLVVPVPLWPDTAPGEKGNLGEEKDVTKPSDGK